ncbi:hypothetical protein GCM10023328_47480 [Modestobacter marinus]|uniref:Sigma-70 family RNA polymerase sigma factor n=1 Tax=Modestobacter marinus TaxID=477641 RepID=A0A846LXM1_9ACTN|nr:hypothetical protein [Modestobacter marinus]NIH70248.1 hypothetical protein [Modestobacter marinus]GGL84823.1 hypothetical protein GCM10011589_46580 [Modestobacter marinus]
MSSSSSPLSGRNGGAALSGGIFGQLIDEWARLCQLPSTARQLRRWSTTEDALVGFTSLQQLVTAIDEGTREEDDIWLGALIRLAQSGQTMAGRTVLQAMLPKLTRFSHTTRPTRECTEPEDHRHVIVASFWTVLSNYPIHRRTSRVAAGLALDTLHALTADTRSAAVEIPVDADALDHWADNLCEVEQGALRGDDELSSDADLLEVIAWGIDSGALSGDDAAVLARVYLPEESKAGSAAIAAELGLSPAALRQRCSRARRRLIAAVQADALGLTAAPARVGEASFA